MGLLGFIAGTAAKAVAKGAAITAGAEVVDKVLNSDTYKDNPRERDPYYNEADAKAKECGMHWNYANDAKRGVPTLITDQDDEHYIKSGTNLKDHVESDQVQHLPNYKVDK